MELFPTCFWSSLPKPAAGQVQAFDSSPRGLKNMADESGAMPTLFSQAQALTTLGTTPLVVLTASESLQTINGWSTAQDRMTALSANSGHQVAHTAHAALLGEEHGAEGHRRRRTGRAHRCTASDKLTAGPMTATGVARGCRVRRVGNVKTSKVQGGRQGVVPAR